MLRCFSFYTFASGTSIAISRKVPLPVKSIAVPSKSTAAPSKLIAPLGRPTIKGKGCKRFPTPKRRSYVRAYDKLSIRGRE